MTEQEIIQADSARTGSVGKTIAITEVVIVRFVLYALIARGLIQFLYGTTNPDPFPLEASYFVGLLWFIIPALMIFGLRRNSRDYGLTTDNVAKSVDLTLSAFPFFLLTSVGFMIVMMMGWSYLEPLGASVVSVFFVISLLLIVRMTQKKYADFQNIEIALKKHRSNIFTIILLLLFPIILGALLNKFTILLVSTVIWQFVFSGFGEEIFFRGYIQSRLNVSFGRPYEWKGIQFGVGLFLTAAIFAITHMLNTADIWAGDFNLAWWWGTFTFVGGLLFGLLREKTQSVIAPGALHGLEAIGEGMALLF